MSRSTTARWWCWSGRIGSRGSTSPGRKRSCFVRCRLVHHPLIIGRKAVSRQVDILQILAGRLSGYPTVGRCGDVRFRAFVKGSMAWLLCLPVGQASSLASSCCSTLFFGSPGLRQVFRRGTNGSESGSLHQRVYCVTRRPSEYEDALPVQREADTSGPGMDTEKTNGDPAPPAITSFSLARNRTSSVQK